MHSVQFTGPTSHDLTTLGAVKLRLDITDSTQDAKLTAQIARVSALIESFLGRAIGPQTVIETWRQNVWRRRDFLPLALAPVTSITTVVEDDMTLVVDDDYELEPATGIVYRVQAGYRFRWGYNVAITYATGWSTVPADIEGIALDLITAAHVTGLRDPAVQLELTEGVGRTAFFDRGRSTYSFDDAMRLALQPYMVQTA